MRHYFPGIDIDGLDDEEFCTLAEDAAWLHSKMIVAQSQAMVGTMLGGIGGGRRK